MESFDFDLPLAAHADAAPGYDVFNAFARAVTLADVLATAMAKLTGTVLRDTRSAFAALARAGIDLDRIAATPADVRDVLAGLSGLRRETVSQA